MTKNIHTIQSKNKDQFDNTINLLIDLGCELMEGAYKVINTDDGIVYSQVIIVKNKALSFYQKDKIESFSELNEKSIKDGKAIGWYETGEKLFEMGYKDGIQDGRHLVFSRNGNKKMEMGYKLYSIF